MRALLLAAGLGTRLRPLTDHLPKCLVPIHGRPLLDHWMETLVGRGVERIVVNTHYMAPLVRRYLEESEWMPWVSLVHEEELLGTGGTILKNRGLLDGGPVLVAHADNLTIFDAEDFARCHAQRPPGAVMSMMLFEADDPRSCGIVELDALGMVQAFHEKVVSPPGNLANAAVYIFEPEIFVLLQGKGKKFIDLSTELIPQLVGRINTYKNSKYHRDIGNISSWREANRDFPVMPMADQNARSWKAMCADLNLEPVLQEMLGGA